MNSVQQTMETPDPDQRSLSDMYDPVSNGHAVQRHYTSQQPCRQTEFDQLFQYSKPRKPALRKRIVKTSGHCSPLKTICSLFPIFTWLPEYQWKQDIVSDIVSGFTVAIMHIPQGMAYALLGGVPPVVGLYMAFFPVLVYIFMGTSRHISMGTFAVVCMMASKSVILYSSNDVSVNMLNSTAESINSTSSDFDSSSTYTPIQVATALCFAVGTWQVLLGVLHMGVLSVLLSDTLVSGFTTGAAVHVLTSQVKNLFGVKVPSHSGPLKIVYTYIDIIKNIHSTNLIALGISCISIVVLSIYNECIKPFVSKKLPIPFPVELLAIITGTLVSMFCNLQTDFNVTVVGEIPTGLPFPTPPPFSLMPKLLIDGLVISIVAFSVNMSMASIFARKLNYSVDANQELLASGFSNIFASFFSCIPFAASLSRSLIQQTVGGKTQLASLVSCLLLLLVLLVIGPFFEPLPNCVLASIVVVALKGMFMQVKDLPVMWRQSPLDGLVWLTTFLSVVLLDIDYGLGMGVALSLLCVLIMGQRPKLCRLGNVPSTDLYLDITRYHAAAEIPGICIIQVAGGLHFANKEHVQRKLYHMVNIRQQAVTNDNTESKVPVKNEKIKNEDQGCEQSVNSHETAVSLLPHAAGKPEVYGVILDMMSVSFLDPSAIKSLLSMYNDFESKGIMFCLADCSATVHERLVHCDFFDSFPDAHVFATVHDAVLFVKQSNCETADSNKVVQ